MTAVEQAEALEAQEVETPPNGASDSSTSYSAPRRGRRKRQPLAATAVNPDGSLSPVEVTEAPAAPRTRRPRVTSNEARAEALRKPLEEVFAGYGTLMLPMSPVTGTVMANRAPQYADGFVALATRNKRVLAVLERLVTGAAVVNVFPLIAALFVAFAVDRGRIPDDAPPVMFLIGEEVATVRTMQDAMQRAEAANIRRAAEVVG